MCKTRLLYFGCRVKLNTSGENKCSKCGNLLPVINDENAIFLGHRQGYETFALGEELICENCGQHIYEYVTECDDLKDKKCLNY